MQSNRSINRTSIRSLVAALVLGSVAALPLTALANNDARFGFPSHDRERHDQTRAPIGRDDTAYRVDPREYAGSDRGRWQDAWRRDGPRGYDDRGHTDRGYDNRGRGDREDDRQGERHLSPRWDILARLRTHNDGRAHQEVVLPRDTRTIRLTATHRRTDVIAAFIEYPNGRRERVPSLEGLLDGSCDARTRLHHRGHRPAVLHLVTAPARDGRRAYFDVLATR